MGVEWVLNAEPVRLHLHGTVGPNGSFALSELPKPRAHNKRLHAELNGVEPKELHKQLPGCAGVIGLCLLARVKHGGGGNEATVAPGKRLWHSTHQQRQHTFMYSLKRGKSFVYRTGNPSAVATTMRSFGMDPSNCSALCKREGAGYLE
jgi:hypothetical protein